jgi:hypothetical protein
MHAYKSSFTHTVLTFIPMDLRDQNKNCRSPEPTKKDKRREG